VRWFILRVRLGGLHDGSCTTSLPLQYFPLLSVFPPPHSPVSFVQATTAFFAPSPRLRARGRSAPLRYLTPLAPLPPSPPFILPNLLAPLFFFAQATMVFWASIPTTSSPRTPGPPPVSPARPGWTPACRTARRTRLSSGQSTSRCRSRGIGSRRSGGTIPHIRGILSLRMNASYGCA
jgi:hypothetical protein